MIGLIHIFMKIKINENKKFHYIIEAKNEK